MQSDSYLIFQENNIYWVTHKNFILALSQRILFGKTFLINLIAYFCWFVWSITHSVYVSYFIYKAGAIQTLYLFLLVYDIPTQSPWNKKCIVCTQVILYSGISMVTCNLSNFKRNNNTALLEKQINTDPIINIRHLSLT